VAGKDNTSHKFTGRTDVYDRFRPGYPQGIVDFLVQKLGITTKSVVADIGSGTGKLAKLFVDRGIKTYGVEINADMRKKAGVIFRGNSIFINIEGSAEDTKLPDQSVDHIFVAQAFHWFDRKRTRAEFNRIIKADGYIVLIWNVRQEDTPFLKAYDTLLKKHFTEYGATKHREIGDLGINEFYGGDQPVAEVTFDYNQDFDLEGLIGRALSSSYVQKDNDEFLGELRELFEQYNRKNQVNFSYKTKVILGKLKL
jgi:ubiquinone/menaquinone biosynthesis C-methylase UbiE